MRVCYGVVYVMNGGVVVGLSLSFELLSFCIFDFELSLAKDLLYSW